LHFQMAIIKRKTISKLATKLAAKNGKALSAQSEAQEKSTKLAANVDEKAQAKVEANEKKALQQSDREQVDAWRKEYKGMAVAGLKQFVENHDLEAGKKEGMVEAAVKFHVKAREEARKKVEHIREVVVQKKQELEALPAPDLKDMCTDVGIKGNLTKEARMEALLKHWQEEDGVDKAVAKSARNARQTILEGQDTSALRQLCERAGLDPYVKDILVERVVKIEVGKGRFSRPKVEEEFVLPAEKAQQQSSDMVDSFLASEVRRKKEQEQRKLAEEGLAAKRTEFKALGVDELKKRIAKAGGEAFGKKDDMVETLVSLFLKSKAAVEKKQKLLAMDAEDLKQLLLSRGVELGKKELKRDAYVELFLSQEAKIRDEAKAFAQKISAVLADEAKDLEGKTAVELKEMCVARNLKPATGKEQLIERIVEDMRASGELDKVVVAKERDARTKELGSMERPALLKLCGDAGADLFVKSVMIERILGFEDEHGIVEPASKKARKKL